MSKLFRDFSQVCFGKPIGWIRGIDVKKAVFLRSSMFRVCGSNLVSVMDDRRVLRTKKQRKEIYFRDRARDLVLIYLRHDEDR